ncbi:MAG TPA: tol-pal system protein YbgF [Thermoanaerobaculia bacterium]|nr:tol-pal system protein YbgF [Thermoanaerobaculia bacterium]
MKTLAAVALALLAAACASSDAATAPPQSSSSAAAAADPRIGELQTAMTELLERIDVLNDRIGRLEESGAAGFQPAVRPVEPVPAQPRRAESAPAQTTAPAVSPQPVQRALVGARIAEDYRKAIMVYGRGSLGEARQAFQSVYDADPAGDLADNALFWIGETYFAAKDYNNALRFYARVTNDYADQNKAPDALYKTALAQERTGDLALARKTLQQVIERYPYSSSASSAKHELQRIRY